MILKKIFCITLILLHIFTFKVTPEALAYLSESANYKLHSGYNNEGGCPDNDNIDRNSPQHKILKDSVGEQTSGEKFSSAKFVIASGFIYLSESDPPVLSQLIPDQTWYASQSKPNAFCLDDYFESPDNYNLTFSYKNLSADKKISVTIDSQTHYVSFAHEAGFIGTEQVEFTATDEISQTTKSNYVNLSVVAMNAPILTIDSPTELRVSENEIVAISAHAIDEDSGDKILFSFTPNSGKVEFAQTVTGDNPANVEATWQTDYESSGNYEVLIRATDLSGFYDEKKVMITVDNVNRAPVINKINGIAIILGLAVELPPKNESELIALIPEAEDSDNDAITFSFNNLGSSEFDNEGKWLTTYDDVGNYEVEIKAFDGNDYSLPQIVKLTIENVNRAPEANLTLSDYTIEENSEVTITLTASDPDMDSMTFSLKINGQEIDSGQIQDNYTKTRQFTTAGEYVIEAIVTDTGGLSTTKSVLLDCVSPNENRDYINPVMGDFNGDSKSDLGLHNSQSDKGIWEICLSDDGEFLADQEWLSNFGTSRDWLPLGGDFDGDGLTDIGIYNNTSGAQGGECKIALSTGSSFSDSGLWADFQEPSYDWIPVCGNFNSDRYTDLAVYNSKTGEWRVALCDGTKFGAFNQWIANFGGDGYSPLTGDFNADGIVDLAVFKASSGEIKVAFGNTEKFIDSGAAWISGFGVDKNLIISDFNNDSSTDIGYWNKSAGSWKIAISSGSSFIQQEQSWLENFGGSSDESAHTGDFNGDGITDAAVFDKDKLGIERWNVNLSTDNYADLLNKIDNGAGATTNIIYDYASKTDNYQVPFSVYVAKSISITDTLPTEQAPETYTQNFAFQGGYFDANQREFRGFERITITDPLTGNYTQTYFYQGKSGQDGALKGKIYKILAYDNNNRLISEINNTWQVRKAGPRDGPLGFPHITEAAATVYERNDTSLTTKEIFNYDNLGNVTENTNYGDVTINKDDRVATTIYALPYKDGFNRPLESALKDQNNNQVTKKTFEYDSKGNLTKETVWLNPSEEGPSTEYIYDSFGNLTSTIDALGHVTITDYETTFYTFPETITNSLGHTIKYLYEPKFGVITQTTDVNSNISKARYDTFGRVKEQENAYGQLVAVYSYPDFNTKVTNQLNLTIKEFTDGLGRKYKTITSGEDGNNPRNVVAEVFYDQRGFVASESLPHYEGEDPAKISYIRYAYDARGRLKSTTNDFPGEGKDATSSVLYLAPLETEAVDPLGHRKGTKKDAFGNVIEIIENTQGGVYHTYYEYDAQNNLTKVTDSQGNVTTIQYDALGRKISMDDPDMGKWSYEYDLLGNLKKQTDAKGQVTEFEYDAINRLERKINGQNLIQYCYDGKDENGNDTSAQNSIGRLSKAIDPNSATEFFYDKLGREITTTKTINITPYTLHRTYDTLDRLTSLTYPDGTILNYQYDPHSGLTEKVYSLDNGQQVDYIKNVSYNATGQIKTILYGNNIQTNYTYGADLRLARIFTQNPQNPIPPLQDLNYDFDKNGNVITIIDNNASQQGKIRRFTYDELDHLKTAENLPDPNGGFTTFEYDYDPIGNILKKGTIYSSVFMTYGEGNAGPHAVTSAGSNSYYYDANGNMASGASKTFEYDAENRLANVTGPFGTTTFAYDGDGGRIKKSIVHSPQSIEETTYIGNLYEILSSGDETQITKHIFLGPSRICSIETDNQQPQTEHRHYYHTDHLGSSNVITNESGEQVSLCEYTPYGIIAKDEGSFSTPYKFTGKELDNTGLYYYGARYYDPFIGRFTQADTIIQAPYDPQSLNRYAYARNNPLRYIDPTGHSVWDSIKNFFSKAKDFIVSAVVTIALNVAGIMTMAATGGSVGFFGYYDAGRDEFEVLGWSIAGGVPLVVEIGKQEGELHVMFTAVSKFGPGGKGGGSPPSSPKPTPSPVSTASANSEAYQPTDYEQTIKEITGKYPSPLTENAVKTSEEKAVEALSKTPISLDLNRNWELYNRGKKIEKFGLGMLQASEYGGYAGLFITLAGHPEIGLPMLSASGAYGWVGLGVQAIGLYLQKRSYYSRRQQN